MNRYIVELHSMYMGESGWTSQLAHAQHLTKSEAKQIADYYDAEYYPVGRD